ncbi:MAG: cobalt-precorrin-6A reductase [Leptolyngbyaceae cyanobacterium SL_7_1]|nr:cobalt-precorrin-6A reductase [Leptolyngbyaceae cyanobacterium SL_7_1]
MAGRVWLIGGTQDSVVLAHLLAQGSLACVVSVTTESARSLYRGISPLSVWVGCLTPETIASFLQTQAIDQILDASHPFAVEISALAIEAAQRYSLPYLRYERANLEPTPTTPANLPVDLPRDLPRGLIELDSFNTLIAGHWLAGQRVLLVVGYRSLPLFQPWQHRATLFARILPSTMALTTALAAGFTPDRLIALRPPLSVELERSLWQHWQISTVVTKASGQAGGEGVKRQVAASLGVRLIVIRRPTIRYPQQTSEIATALAFCQRLSGLAGLTPPPD